MPEEKPPFPPFTRESAAQKVQAAEDAWWWRSYGNELWEFDEHGPMRRREASTNDLRIDESERRIFGRRTEGERGQEFPLQ